MKKNKFDYGTSTLKVFLPRRSKRRDGSETNEREKKEREREKKREREKYHFSVGKCDKEKYIANKYMCPQSNCISLTDVATRTKNTKIRYRCHEK